MKRTRQMLGIDRLHRQGLTGKGVTVAVLDSGVGRHPDFQIWGGRESRIVDFADMVNGRRAGMYDDNGHGTHVAGIIGGNGMVSKGVYTGIAPECNLIMVKVLNRRGEANVKEVLRGLAWIRAHRQQYGIRIVNISVGSTRGKEFGEDSPLVQGVDDTWDAGMVVLTAAGNHGPESGSIGAPGNSRKIITVGSSDGRMMKGNRVVRGEYSGGGPTESCIKKPDIVAPGTNIVSCSTSGTYMTKSGTSMSTPIVSGCIALLLQKYPWMTNREVKIWLRDYARDLGKTHDRQGWGMIDMRSLQ